jgi:hypothetical protein
MSKDEVKLFDDIEMCLKRISDFLGSQGYIEVRKYIERYENHLNSAKKEVCKAEVDLAPEPNSYTIEEVEVLLEQCKRQKQIIDNAVYILNHQLKMNISKEWLYNFNKCADSKEG